MFQNTPPVEEESTQKMEVDENPLCEEEKELMNSETLENQQTLQKRFRKMKLQEEESVREKLRENVEMNNGLETKTAVDWSDSMSVVSDITHVHPGLQVFDPLLFGRYYSAEFLLTENILMISPAYLQRLIIKETLKTPESLFRLMAVVSDGLTAESCWERLSSIYPNWTIPFAEIVLAFLNWGASVEIFSVPAETVETVMTLDNLCKERRSYSGKPCDFNIRFVLYYVLHTFELLKPSEVIIMFRILVTSALDSNFKTYVFHFKRTIGALLDSVSQSLWTDIVNELIMLINLNDLETENAVFVCSTLLPQSLRGHQIALQLSHWLLQKLLNVKCNARDNCNVTVKSILNVMYMAVDIHEEPHQKLYNILMLIDNMVVRIGSNINVDDLKKLCTTCSNLKSQLDHIWMNKLHINYSLLRELIARTVSLWGMKITHILENSLYLGPQYVSY